MAIETVLIGGSFLAVAVFMTWQMAKTKFRKEHMEYRGRINRDFIDLYERILSAYGTTLSETVPEYIDDEGNVIPEHTEVRVVLENKSVSSALVHFQASLYQ